MTDFPDLAPSKPLWLVTLADLALLLIGFLVLVQATAAPERMALTRSLNEAFGADTPPAMPVAAYAARFAPGSAVVTAPAPLVRWARAELADPRVQLTVTGATDGSPGDVDPVTRSAALLAADRARAVAALLAPHAGGRLRVATDPRPLTRTATVTLAFAGERR